MINLEEFLNKKIIAISNYKISADTEVLSSKFDVIVRFNGGSNPNNLSQYNFYNGRTDLCVLSGWGAANFGDLSGFKNQQILFSRPKFSLGLKYNYHNLAVRQAFENKILEYTTNISYIPDEVFYDFSQKYQYFYPTTGLIFLYYAKLFLKLDISCINFFIDSSLYNTFLNMKSSTHNVNIERSILNDLHIDNINI